MEVQVSLAPEKALLGMVGHGWAGPGGRGKGGMSRALDVRLAQCCRFEKSLEP